MIILSQNIKNIETIKKDISKNPIEAGISLSKIDKIAKSLINKRATHTSAASFTAGILGGLAMVATIPADTLQFLGTAIKLSQELAYLYSYENLCD